MHPSLDLRVCLVGHLYRHDDPSQVGAEGALDVPRAQPLLQEVPTTQAEPVSLRHLGGQLSPVALLVHSDVAKLTEDQNVVLFRVGPSAHIADHLLFVIVAHLFC